MVSIWFVIVWALIMLTVAIGGVKTAVLGVGGEYYQVKYSIKVSKTITAIDVYQEAIKWIESQRLSNRIEPTMANEAIDYLRNEFKKEFK